MQFNILLLSVTFLFYFILFSCESKVLQYFANLKHNSVDLNAFAECLKVTNHIEP